MCTYVLCVLVCLCAILCSSDVYVGMCLCVCVCIWRTRLWPVVSVCCGLFVSVCVLADVCVCVPVCFIRIYISWVCVYVIFRFLSILRPTSVFLAQWIFENVCIYFMTECVIFMHCNLVVNFLAHWDLCYVYVCIYMHLIFLHCDLRVSWCDFYMHDNLRVNFWEQLIDFHEPKM